MTCSCVNIILRGLGRPDLYRPVAELGQFFRELCSRNIRIDALEHLRDKIPKPSEIYADNIIKPNFEELPEEHRQAYEEYKKAREEKEMQEFLAKFKKDRQGNITSIKEIKFPPLHNEQVEPAVRKIFSSEQSGEITTLIAQNNDLIYQAIIDNNTARNNTP